MHVIIGDQKVDLTGGSNGRLQATFTATEDTQSIRIPSDCIGTLNVSDIQLEQGPQATPFVEPAVQSEDMSGIFKDLHELRVDIKDTDEDLRHEIKINQDGFEQAVSNLEEGLNSRITSTADTFQASLRDTKSDLESTITQTAQTWQAKLSDTERGLRNVIQSKADSLIALVEDKEKGLNNQIVINQRGLEQLISDTEERLDSRITIMADTWQGELSDAKRGLNNQITSTAELWQTKLSDTEQELRSVIQSRADSLITLIEDTDSANFSKTEQLVNGLQSTVQGDLRSQRVQLENLISSRIESATGSRSSIWQTLNSHGSQISNAEGDISKVEQTVSGYSRRISDVEGKYSSIEQTVSGLNTEVNGYNGLKSRTRQLEGLIDARVTRSDVEGIIQNSGDSIWLAIGSRVQETADNATMTGDEIISEINLSRDGVRISGKSIFLDSNVTWTRDFRTRFASVLQLRADQITSGTIDASRIRVINLDANSITGQSSRFLSAVFPNMNTYATIDDRGIMITGSDAWRRSHFNHVGIELYNGSGAYNKAGVIGYFKPNTNVAGSDENVMQRSGSRHSIGIGVSESHDLTFGWTNTRANSQVHTPAMIFNSEHKRIELQSSLNAPASTQGIRLNSEQHRGDYGVQIRWTGSFRSRLVLTNNTYLEAHRAIDFYTQSGVRNFTMHQNNDSWQDLSMHGNTILHQSDRRLKRDISPTEIDSLAAIKRWEIVDFNWIDEILDKKQGRQLGVVAQDTPEIARYDKVDDRWDVDGNKQTMMNSHTIQQLAFEVDDQVATLKKELSNAKKRIKELEDKLERAA